MTSIAATQYSPYYPTAKSASTTYQANASTSNAAQSDSATNVTLSEEAKKALAERDFATVTVDARGALDTLLADAGLTSPLKEDGTLAIDITGLDRREIFAIATNSEGKFTADEQDAAQQELARRFDAALAGPAAVARVTDDMVALYKAALDYLDGASAEEKATSKWINTRDSVAEAHAQIVADPSSPATVENDPVVDYIARVSTGDTVQSRDFSDVARDVRAALDKQYADAKADDKELVFSTSRKVGQMVDFSKFDSRSLSAIALNEGGQFTAEEARAAHGEMRVRSRKTLLACVENASSGSDPTALAKNIMSAIASLSGEERAAVGWGEEFYETVMMNYESASRISQMFGDAGSGNGSAGGGMSLLNYL